MIKVFFIISWGMVLTSIAVLFALLHLFHTKNDYFPNLYSKDDLKKIKSIAKQSEIKRERSIVKLMLVSFYLLNIFIILPILVELYLFSK